MQSFVTLPKLSRGDRVAVISPSAGLPGLYPWVQDLGLERLRTVFGLDPVEYPTTRVLGSSLQARAHDVLTAFANPAHKAVFTTIGGEDQIQLLKYLDPAVLRANPKPFFGFSDNTHLVNYLWNLGIPSYYGGMIMTQLAMPGHMHELTVQSLGQALFERGEVELTPSSAFTDERESWADPITLTRPRPLQPNEGWHWDGIADGSGRLWGGCVESLIAQVAVGHYLPSSHTLQGTVLYLETSEWRPAAWILAYLLTGFGERGWLDLFQAVLVGRPQVWHYEHPLTSAAQAAYHKEQRETIIRTVRQYNAQIPIVQNLNFGHTDPQIAIPSGQQARVLTTEKRIFLSY
jgi:muramoyltetrapeptide carboxypeptidase LdcA involved in peptidoglycan recycling